MRLNLISGLFASMIWVNGASAQSDQKFDLLCTGFYKSPIASTFDGRIFQTLAHIDLSSHQYCFNECSQTGTLQIDPNIMGLKMTIMKDDRFRFDIMYISRISGEFSIGLDGLGSTGNCKKELFTPFPDKMF